MKKGSYRPHNGGPVTQANRPKSQSAESTKSIPPPTDDGFATSVIVAAVTDSALLGVAVGGNLAGAIVGDLLNSGE